MSDNKTRLGHALLWIFALSGFAGLIYQSIWTQYMGLFLGHSAHAQSLVLMLFMGGMALGAWLASRRSEALRRPLLAYAAIELAIGVLPVCASRPVSVTCSHHRPWPWVTTPIDLPSASRIGPCSM